MENFVFNYVKVPGIIVFAIIGALFYAGCDSQGGNQDAPIDAEPPPPAEPTVELSTDRGAPFEVVNVTGSFTASVDSAVITVGDRETVLMKQPAIDVYQFAIPQLSPGPVDVTIPSGVLGTDEVTLDFTIEDVEFVGGTPEAAVAALGDQMEELKIQVALAERVLDTETDSTLLLGLQALSATSQALQEEIAQLDAEGRKTLASLYTAHNDLFGEIVTLIQQRVAELDGRPAILPLSVGAGSMTMPKQGAASVADLISSCERTLTGVTALEEISTYLSAFSTASSLIGLGLALTGGGAIPGATLISLALTAEVVDVGITTGIVVLGSFPRFMYPTGLRFEPSSNEILEDGGTGDLRAFLRLQTLARATEVENVAGAVKNTRERIKEIEEALDEARKLDWGQLLKKAGKTGLSLLIDQAKAAVREVSNDVLGSLIGGETPVTFDGLTVNSGLQSGLWEFTSPATGTVRSFQTIGTLPVDDPSQPVSLSASVGARDGCRAATATSQPEQGINGFVIIRDGATVQFQTTNYTTDLEAGAQVAVRLLIVNRGPQDSGALRYEVSTPYTTPYSGLTVAPPLGPTQLAVNQTRTVQMAVEARADAPEQSHVIEVTAYQDGERVSTSYVEINVTPQLSNIIVSNPSSSVTLIDFGRQDGDIINMTLNGTSVVSGHSLLNAGTSFPLTYRAGQNVLAIQAVNEGSISPNTAELRFADVVQGSARQQYGLSTGQIVRVVVTYDPNAIPSRQSKASSALVQPRCGEPGASLDCWTGE